jgi:hypothetical protein
VSWLDLRLVDDQLAVVVDTTAVGDYDGIITVDSNGGAGDIRVLATVIAPTVDDLTYIIQPEDASPVAASGPSTTEAPEMVNGREHIGSRHTLDVRQGNPAEPDEIRPLPGAHRPPDRHHRLPSTRGPHPRLGWYRVRIDSNPDSRLQCQSGHG